MKVFLDSSVLLSASASALGASRLLFEEEFLDYRLITSEYCLAETEKNLVKLASGSEENFERYICPRLEIASNALVYDQLTVYPVTKDKPVIFSALKSGCLFLLTLDKADFQRLLGNQIYGMRILSPGQFVRFCRDS